LVRISQGGNLDEIADELGINKSSLRARVEFLVREGYLEVKALEVGLCGGCITCLKGSSCVISDDPSKGNMYTLTEKGLNEIHNYSV